ncbi:RNA polymerase sigma factor [Mycetocola zhadangensis]|uniref:RNA polymerase sigma factor n=1 Tax=Mycetocola zhadangensis TaxID=1164595 RepID=UPI0015FF3FD7|nr:sigma-70 family RNA polymerase sigma factor [Mycetocola zhadangensis]GGF03371.1 hypothetical protein GCM10011313_28140 [Mycetocola zhadangensis]
MSVNPLADARLPTNERDANRTFDDDVRPLIVPLHRYLRRRVDSAPDADDCLSEALLVLWRHRDRLPADVSEKRLWAFGVAKGVLSNHHRSQRRRAALHERMMAEQRIAQKTSDTNSNAAVYDALAKLKTADREPIMLVAWDGFAVVDAGTLLGLSAAAARTRYSRAKAKLRNELM